MSCVSLKEVNLAHSDEGTSLFRLISEGVDHLIYFQWQVLV